MERRKKKRVPKAKFLGFADTPPPGEVEMLTDHLLGRASPCCCYFGFKIGNERKAFVVIYKGRFLMEKLSEVEKSIILLHEQGHAHDHLKSRLMPDPVTFQHMWKSELSAWKYAFRCIKPEHHPKARRVCLLGLRTHTQMEAGKRGDHDILLLKLAGYKGWDYEPQNREKS